MDGSIFFVTTVTKQDDITDLVGKLTPGDKLTILYNKASRLRREEARRAVAMAEAAANSLAISVAIKPLNGRIEVIRGY